MGYSGEERSRRDGAHAEPQRHGPDRIGLVMIAGGDADQHQFLLCHLDTADKWKISFSYA